VKVAQEALGGDSFAVLTIGFDTRNDTPQRMASFARARGVSLPNWWFLSTDSATIERLTRDLGFVFFPSPKGFDHTAQTLSYPHEFNNQLPGHG
jgi:protein SCO1/2